MNQIYTVLFQPKLILTLSETSLNFRNIKGVLLIIALFLISFQLVAVNYTFTGPGNYNNTSLWSPSYPGKTIGSSHQVTINGNMTLIENLTIQGDLIISSGSVVTGTKKIKEVSSGGTLVSNGTINKSY